MTAVTPSTTVRLTLPDHTQLPESDGTFVKNFQEHPTDRFDFAAFKTAESGWSILHWSRRWHLLATD
ncbi:hypothetical protein [Phormidesmis sp. 146-33]